MKVRIGKETDGLHRTIIVGGEPGHDLPIKGDIRHDKNEDHNAFAARVRSLGLGG